ncbi:MAG TPA: DUF445 family protein [Chitinophagaceae bacterium]|nr:DUF445 family protein [Chitinophagaceae bacterium]
MNPALILIPLISAFIGYFTNWIAIKMLFHPRVPYRFMGITIQGIFPKRQQQFGEKLGKLVSNEFLSFRDIEQKITDPANLEKLLPMVDQHIDVFLHTKLPKSFPMISMFVGEKTMATLKGAFLEELTDLFPLLMHQYVNSMQKELDLEHIVEEKVKEFSSDKLEAILYQIMAKEFKFVEILGGILGLLIGVIQVVITLLFL